MNILWFYRRGTTFKWRRFVACISFASIARLSSCFVKDTGDLITLRGSTLLAPARPAARGKLFTSLPDDKIVEREDVIS